jgi:hypothetical protein
MITPASFCSHMSPPLLRPRGEPVSALRVGAGEKPQLGEPVHLAFRLDRGEADASHAYAAHPEGIGAAPVLQRPAAAAGAADVGGLDLMHFDHAVRRQPGNRTGDDRVGSPAGRQ